MKKIIALMLSAIMVFSFAAVSADDETASADFEYAAALGFIDGENMYEESVITRIELAEVFYNILIGSDIDFNNHYTAVDFPDVPQEKKHIAATVYGMGIMKGYSDTVFAPDDAVTYNQLMKTFVVFLGYELPALKVGGWPSGYLTQAGQLGILPGGASGDSLATVGAVCTMLKKCATVDIATPTSDGGFEIRENTSFLKYYRNIEIGKGTVTGNYLTNLSGDDISTYFSVYVDDKLMQVASSAAGIQDMLGYEVYLYYENTGDGDKIVYFEEGQNSVIDIASDEISSVSGGKIIYYPADTAQKTVSVAQTASVIYNGSYLGSYTDSDLNPYKNNLVDGSLRLIDKNFDNVYDTVVVTAYTTYVVSDVRDLKIYNVYNPSDVIDITGYVERNIDIVNVLGEPVEPSSIKAGHVVNICRDKAKNVKRIIVSKDSMSGIIEEIEGGSTITAIKVNGTTFETSSAVSLFDSQSRLSPGLGVRLYFNCENKVAYIDIDSEFINGFTVGLLVNAYTEEGLSGGTTAHIFGSDGIMHTVTFPEKLDVNGTKTDSGDLMSKFGLDTDGRVKRQAILYKTDAEDATIVTELQLADTSGVCSDGFYEFPSASEDGTFSYRGSFRSFDNRFVSDDNTVILGMPTLEDRDEYDEYALSALSTTEGTYTLNLQAYGTEKEGMVADIIVINAADAAAGDISKRPFFIVDRISEVLNEETGESETKVYGCYVEGITYYEGGFAIDEKLLKEACGGTLPERGDIFRFPTFKTTGKITSLSSREFYDIFDYSEKEFMSGGANPGQEGSSYNYYYWGKVMEKSGDVIKIKLYNSSEEAVFLLTANYFKIIEITSDDKGEIASIKAGAPSSVLAESTHPGEASDVLVYNRGSGIAIVVFN